MSDYFLFLKKGFFKDHFISKIFSVISVDFLIRKLKDEVFFLQSWAWIRFSQILPSMSMVFTYFNIVCCCKCRVFTHSKVWWNQLNRLGNTFIHKCISVSKLKTNGISPVFLWMFFDATFSRSHIVFVYRMRANMVVIFTMLTTIQYQKDNMPLVMRL